MSGHSYDGDYERNPIRKTAATLAKWRGTGKCKLIPTLILTCILSFNVNDRWQISETEMNSS